MPDPKTPETFQWIKDQGFSIVKIDCDDRNNAGCYTFNNSHRTVSLKEGLLNRCNQIQQRALGWQSLARGGSVPRQSLGG